MDGSPSTKKVLVCVHHRLTDAKPSCGARGGARIAELLEREIDAQNLHIAVERMICFGMCERGPNVRLAPGGRFFHGVTPEQIPGVVQAIREFLQVDF